MPGARLLSAASVRPSAGLTTEGTRAQGPLTGPHSLAVSAVDGKPLPKPVVIEVERLGRFPACPAWGTARATCSPATKTAA
jgi:hypothetical protein